VDLVIGKKSISFQKVELEFQQKHYKDIFADKNNKTVAETLKDERYKKLKPTIIKYYPKNLDYKLGDFLLLLKKDHDENYRLFLNQYGDKEYSQFYVSDSITDKKGLYLYCVDGKLKYIGRCLDNFNNRINQGYGKIHPKNCYKDGQATNCRLNALITQNKGKVSLWICPLGNDAEIRKLEKSLIEKYHPEWNI
jgi:hypothetical protein